MRTAECRKKRIWLWTAKRRLSVHSKREFYGTAGKRRTAYSVEIEVMGAAETLLQHLSKKKAMKETTVLRARRSLPSSMPRSPSWLKKTLSDCSLSGEENSF